MTVKQKRRIAIIAVLIIAALTGTFFAMRAIRVDDYVYGAGYITTPNRSKVLSAEKGPVKRLLAEDGARVKAGDVLLELDDSDLLAQVDQFKAEVKLAEAELERQRSVNADALKRHEDALNLAKVVMENAQRDYERDRKLAETGAVSAGDVEKKKHELDLTTARHESERSFSPDALEKEIVVLQRKVELARQQLDQANAALARRKVASPIDGVLNLSILAVGEIVDPSRPLGEVFDDSSFIIRVKVSERNFHKVKVGQPASASISAYPHRIFGYFPGKVQSLSQVVTPQTSSEGHLITEIIMDSCKQPLKPGMAAEVRILVGRTSLFEKIVNIE